MRRNKSENPDHKSSFKTKNLSSRNIEYESLKLSKQLIDDVKNSKIQGKLIKSNKFRKR